MLRIPIELPTVRLRCPQCHAASLSVENTADRELRCSSCGHALRIEGGVIDLLGKEARPPTSRTQKLMESSWFARIYESRWARRNPLLRRVAGISFEQESRLLRKAAKLKGAERVLDVACGTGNHSRRFAKAVPRGVVVGLDRSRTMLEEAGRRAREAEIHNLVFVRGDALALPFDEGSFDVVDCGAGMHLMSPLDRALAEMHRVLVPGGRLTASAPRKLEGTLMSRLFRNSDKRLGVHPFAPGELERAWEKAGFTNIAVLHAYRGWLVLRAEKPKA